MEMKPTATDLPTTIQQYQLGLDCAYNTGKIIGEHNAKHDDFEMNGLRQRSTAWYTVCEALNKVDPGWMDRGGTVAECAVKTIKFLAGVSNE